MKKTFIVANWKSNKTEPEAIKWLQEYQISNIKYPILKEVIVCPPFTLLPVLKSHILNHKSAIKLGAQDISPFYKGSYTGEVSGEQIKEFGDFVIIGHSERRKYFNEKENLIEQKVEMAKDYKLNPILCVQGEVLSVPKGVEIVAYEPVFAIGTGNPDVPENADKIAGSIKEKNKIKFVLYGGSVTSKNVRTFTEMPNIDGVLVGSASLDPLEFAKIIEQT
ncbi:MAG: triose-phosphate isomerase [Patescibacteria group bacterium]|nr:triose-phosphate isomerase [Patescibacteria group bacterium]